MSEEQNTSRRARRAAKKGGTDAEAIKDRNQKLREEAAAKRRKKRTAERNVAGADGLDAQERVDDALVRGADATTRFVKKNFAWIQWLVVLTIFGAMVLLVVDYRKEQSREKAGDALAEAIDATFGRVSSAEPLQATDPNLVDTRPEYSSAEEKTKAELERWKGLAALGGQEIDLLSQLGVAGAFYDAGKYEEARKKYRELAENPSITQHEKLYFQALEGVALSLEALDQPKKALDALGRFENAADVYGQRLAQFHEARIRFGMGEKDKALEILTTLDEKLSENAGAEGPTDYLGAAVRDLLKTVDPSKIEQQAQGISPEQLEQLKKQLEAMQQGGGAPTMPMAPPAQDGTEDTPASEEPAQEPASANDKGAQAPAPQPAPTPEAPAPQPAPTPESAEDQ